MIARSDNPAASPREISSRSVGSAIRSGSSDDRRRCGLLCREATSSTPGLRRPEGDPAPHRACGGHNRKTDGRDAHSIAIAIAIVAVRTKTLRVLKLDGELEALRVLCDRREALTRRRVQTVDRLQALLAELLPGQATRDLTTGQAKAMLASVRPRDVAGRTRRRIAAEELGELVAVEAKIKKATAELKSIVVARGPRLMDLRGVLEDGTWIVVEEWMPTERFEAG